FFSSRRRHTRSYGDWSSDVCSSDLLSVTKGMLTRFAASLTTKKQAKEVVKEAAKCVNMPFVTERWLGGMLTNFTTIRKSIKKMRSEERRVGNESKYHRGSKK